MTMSPVSGPIINGGASGQWALRQMALLWVCRHEPDSPRVHGSEQELPEATP
jgi:hypothetical protein